MVIGITGQSGAGTSSVGEILERRIGVLFINADKVYHSLLEKDEALSSALAARFGEGILRDGKVDRRALSKVVFFDEEALADLSKISHARVLAEIRSIIEQNPGKNVAVEAIALFESGFAAECDVTVCVTAKSELQVRRIAGRDKITEEDAKTRLAAQKSADFFRSRAAYEIVNDGTFEQLEQKVAEFWDKINSEG